MTRRTALRSGVLLLAVLALLALPAVLGGCSRSAERADGGNEANNGGGTGEKDVRTAFQALPHYIGLAVGLTGFGFDASEQVLLARLLHRLREQPLRETQLRFSTPRRTPGLFRRDGLAHGTARSAVTGDAWGGEIWINLDHLYTDAGGGRLVPLDVPGSAALLLDELFHHLDRRFQDPREHEKLDTLCAKFRRFHEVVGKGLEECETPGRVRRVFASWRAHRRPPSHGAGDPSASSIQLTGCFRLGAPDVHESPLEMEALLETRPGGRPRKVPMEHELRGTVRQYVGEFPVDRIHTGVLVIDAAAHADNATIDIGYRGGQGADQRATEMLLGESKRRLRQPVLSARLHRSLQDTLGLRPNENGVIEATMVICEADGRCRAEGIGPRPDRGLRRALEDAGTRPRLHPLLPGSVVGVHTVSSRTGDCELDWLGRGPGDIRLSTFPEDP